MDVQDIDDEALGAALVKAIATALDASGDAWFRIDSNVRINVDGEIDAITVAAEVKRILLADPVTPPAEPAAE